MLRRLGGWLLVVLGGLLAIAGAAVHCRGARQRGAVRSSGTWRVLVRRSSPARASSTSRARRCDSRPSRLTGRCSSESAPRSTLRILTSDLTYTQIDEIALRDGELQTSEVQGSQDLLADVPGL